MSEINPYAPPAADLTLPAGDGTLPRYFPVSTTKFVVMSIFTLSIYPLYWFYMNWRSIREREKSTISPFWRTMFSIFFCHSLFRDIQTQEVSVLGESRFSAGWMATGWIVFGLLGNLSDLLFVLGFASFLFMLPPVKAIQRINAAVAPGHDRNETFSGWNSAAVAVGILILVLIVIGLVLPVE